MGVDFIENHCIPPQKYTEIFCSKYYNRFKQNHIDTPHLVS